MRTRYREEEKAELIEKYRESGKSVLPQMNNPGLNTKSSPAAALYYSRTILSGITGSA
jgi:hypothetical protein